MAIKKISQFTAGTPTSADKMLFEQSGAGKSASIGDVGKAIGINMDLLWTNADPYSSFVEQTLTLDISKYKLLVVVSLPNNGNLNNMLTNLLIVGDHENRISISYYSNDTTISRVIKLNNSSIIISDGCLNGSLNNNNQLIPYKIYGVK